MADPVPGSGAPPSGGPASPPPAGSQTGAEHAGRHAALPLFGGVFQWVLAARYFRSRWITWLAVSGYALGVAVLIIVNSVMTGFGTDLRRKIRGTTAHLSGIVAGYGKVIPDATAVAGALEKIPHVVSVSPHLEWLFLRERASSYSYLVGIDGPREARTTDYGAFLLDGDLNFGLNGKPAELPGAVIGCDLSRLPVFCAACDRQEIEGRVCSKCGGPLTEDKRCPYKGGAFGMFTIRPSTGWFYKPVNRKFVVTGWYKSGMFEYDKDTIYVPIAALQEALDVGDAATRFCVKVDDYDNPAVVASVRDKMEETLDALTGPGRTYVKTWEEEKSTFLRAVEMERRLNFIIMFFIVIVAAFILLAILSMMVTEKRRDIGIVRSLGATVRGVAGVFLLEAILIGLFGCALGVALGYLVSDNINAVADGIHTVTGWHPFPPSVYILDRIPSEIRGESILTVFVSAMVLSVIFSLVPVIKAGRIDPIEAIRYE